MLHIENLVNILFVINVLQHNHGLVTKINKVINYLKWTLQQLLK